MKLFSTVSVVAVTMVLLTGCNSNEGERKLVVEEVDAYKPNLPSVPSIPKPSVPEIHPDSTYSIYGLRKQIVKTIETEVTITGYIAKIYQKPTCEEGKSCYVVMPHLFLADEKGETLDRRMIRLVGYAKSFKEMEDQQEKDKKGVKEEPLPDGMYLPPVIWDWREGHKYKITGRFTRQSGEGFMTTDGLLEYVSHECLDCPVEEIKK